MTTPGEYDLTIYQGSTFTQRITWKDSLGALISLVGYTARMQIRPSVGDLTVLASLTTENGGIALGGAAATIDLTMTAAATALITARKGVYDLELVSPAGVVTRLLAGAVTFSPEVTR